MFWSTAGAVADHGATFVGLVAAARLLGREEFGELGMLLSVVSALGALVGAGFGTAAAMAIAGQRARDVPRIGRTAGQAEAATLVTGGIVALLLALLAPQVASLTMNAPHLASALRVGSGIFLFSALAAAYAGILTGFESFREVAAGYWSLAMLKIPVLVAGTWMWGLAGFVAAMAASTLCGCFVYRAAVVRQLHRIGLDLTRKAAPGEVPDLWKRSLPIVLSNAAAGAAIWVTNHELVAMPGGYDQMGLFSAAGQWHYIVLFLPVLAGGVLLPLFSERLGARDVLTVKTSLRRATMLSAVASVPVALAAIAASGPVMALYGPSFDAGRPCLIMMLAAAALAATLVPAGQLLLAAGRVWTSLAVNAAWAAVLVLSSGALAPRGASGLAAAYLLAYGAYGLALCAAIRPVDLGWRGADGA